MAPVNDEDGMVTGGVADVPVRSDRPKDAVAVAEGRNDNDGGVEERQTPLEEAGYGYGV